MRKAIRDQKTSRGYYDGKSLGKSSATSKGGGSARLNFSAGGGRVQFRGSSERGTKVHVDMLKLRTRCAKCGIIGHWAKECTNEPNARGRQREAMSGKTGFCEMSAGGSQSEGFFFGDQHQHEPLTLGSFLPKRQMKSPITNAGSFHGLTTRSEHGVVDTAAQGGLIGRESLQRLEGALSRHGLKVLRTEKEAQARGIGGKAHVCGVVEIPLGIAGINDLLECTVVEEEVPLLLSVKF